MLAILGRPARLDPMRLATWNVNSLKTRLDRVLAWLQVVEPDVLCMQETKLTDTAMPLMDFRALGYEVAQEWGGDRLADRVGGRCRRPARATGMDR